MFVVLPASHDMRDGRGVRPLDLCDRKSAKRCAASRSM